MKFFRRQFLRLAAGAAALPAVSRIALALSGKELARCRTLRLGPSPVPPHKNHS